MINRDTIFSIVVILISIGAYFNVGDLTMDSRLFPQVVAGLLILFNIIHLLQSFKPRERKEIFANVRIGRLCAMAAGLLAYVFMMVYIGFVPASLIFMIFFTWYLNEDRKNSKVMDLLKPVLFSVIFVLVFYFLFNNMFMVPLPKGVFFGG